MDTIPRFVTVKTAAAHLGLSTRTVHRLIRAGLLEARQSVHRGRWLLPADRLAAGWLEYPRNAEAADE